MVLLIKPQYIEFPKYYQVLYKPLKSELDKLVEQGVLHKLRPDE